MNAQLEVRTLRGLKENKERLSREIVALPAGTDARTLAQKREEWRKAKEAERVFIYNAKPALTARGTTLRH